MFWEEKKSYLWGEQTPHPTPPEIEVSEDFLMGILSQVSDFYLLQKFLLSTMTSSLGGFNPPTFPGTPNSLLSELIKEEENRTQFHYALQRVVKLFL